MEPTPDGLPLPYVTVCPGFKPGTFASVESEEYPHYLVDKFTPAETVATPGQVERWFMERTFELSEGEGIQLNFMYLRTCNNFRSSI